jgi:hypothetical protein
MRLLVCIHILMEKVPFIDLLMMQRLKIGYVFLLLTVNPVGAMNHIVN